MNALLNDNESILFSGVCYDEIGFKIERGLLWVATGGTITEYGLFTAGETPGNFEITATDTFSNVSALFGITVEQLTDLQEEYTIPEKFALYQNYLNPFNPQTAIEFQLPVESRVKLEVFDILGRRIGRIIDDLKSPGGYKYYWNGSEYTLGVYFYRVEMIPVNGSRRYSQVKKMILIK
ncbi:MAG: hypothetical protein RDU14_17095 [Melioribacteraceae bacterium]|nr:hypothetical protein [Melioribacteraceae bacterium]